MKNMWIAIPDPTGKYTIGCIDLERAILIYKFKNEDAENDKFEVRFVFDSGEKTLVVSFEDCNTACDFFEKVCKFLSARALK